MKKLKRALLLCFVGICCAGLWLASGSPGHTSRVQAGTDGTKDGLVGYCPIGLFGYFNGQYYYAVTTPGAFCNTTMYLMTDRPHQVGCPDCPDPIITTLHPTPLPKADEASDLTPKPDPLFSGVLR